MEPAELSTMLKPFFTRKPEKSVEGKPYSHNTVKANSFRAGQIFFLVHFKEIIRDKVFKLASISKRSCATGIDFFHKAQASNFEAKTLKSSMQQISLVWILRKVLQIRHGLTPFSASEIEAVKTNAKWNPVTFSSTTTPSRLKYFISSENAMKISPPSSAPDFTHSVFHGCKFWDWSYTFLSSPVFEQSVGIYEPKAPSFRVFNPTDVTRINFRWQLVKSGPITVEIKLVKPIKFTPTRQSRTFAIRSPLAFLPCLRAVLKFCKLKINGRLIK